MRTCNAQLCLHALGAHSRGTDSTPPLIATNLAMPGLVPWFMGGSGHLPPPPHCTKNPSFSLLRKKAPVATPKEELPLWHSALFRDTHENTYYSPAMIR